MCTICMIDCGFQCYVFSWKARLGKLGRAQSGLFRKFDCFIRVSRSFLVLVANHSKHLGGSGPCKARPWLWHCECVRKYTTTNYYSSIYLYIDNIVHWATSHSTGCFFLCSIIQVLRRARKDLRGVKPLFATP